MFSDNEAAEVNCSASIFDAMGQLSDTDVLTFSVNPNPSGIVRSTAVMSIPNHSAVNRT